MHIDCAVCKFVAGISYAAGAAAYCICDCCIAIGSTAIVGAAAKCIVGATLRRHSSRNSSWTPFEDLLSGLLEGTLRGHKAAANTRIQHHPRSKTVTWSGDSLPYAREPGRVKKMRPSEAKPVRIVDRDISENHLADATTRATIHGIPHPVEGRVPRRYKDGTRTSSAHPEPLLQKER